MAKNPKQDVNIDLEAETMAQEAAELDALAGEVESGVETTSNVDSEGDKEVAAQLAELDKAETTKKATSKSAGKKAEVVEDEANFRFERVVSPDGGKTYLRVYHQGELQPYYGSLLLSGVRQIERLESYTKQQPVRTILNLELNEVAGKSVRELAINGVCFIIPKGVYLTLPNGIAKQIETAHVLTEAAGAQYKVSMDPVRKFVLNG